MIGTFPRSDSEQNNHLKYSVQFFFLSLAFQFYDSSAKHLRDAVVIVLNKVLEQYLRLTCHAEKTSIKNDCIEL